MGVSSNIIDMEKRLQWPIFVYRVHFVALVVEATLLQCHLNLEQKYSQYCSKRMIDCKKLQLFCSVTYQKREVLNQ